MGRNYLTEAFKEMELLESKSFGLDKQGLEGLDSFLDTDELKDIETIIDPEAMTEDDLEASYIGKIILGCDVCHSMIYKAPEEIIIDEESQMANVGELCPYCFTGDGYKVVGKVAPYKDITVEASGDVDVKVDGKAVESTEEEVVDEALTLDQKYPIKSPIAEGVADTLRSRRRSSKIFTKESIDNSDNDETLDEEIEKDQKYPIKSPIAESVVIGNKEPLGEELSNKEKLLRAFPELNFDEPVIENFQDEKGSGAWNKQAMEYFNQAAKKLGLSNFEMNSKDNDVVIITAEKDGKKISGESNYLDSLEVRDIKDAEEFIKFTLPDLYNIDESLTKDQKYPVKSPISESMEDITQTISDYIPTNYKDVIEGYKFILDNDKVVNDIKIDRDSKIIYVSDTLFQKSKP